MRKQLIPLIITLLSLIGNNTFAQWANGDGSAGNPWQISTKADLNTIATYVNNNWDNFSGDYFIMMNDIDMSVSGTFNPIGNASNRTFGGNFNGNGKVISNLTKSGTTYIGLFGNILNATIYNLGIEGTTITTTAGTSYGGGLVAYSTSSNITGCYVITANNAITGGGNGCRVGGLIGNANKTTINNCYARAGITNSGTGGTRYYGGLVGYLEVNSLISNSYSAPISLTATTNRGSLIGGVNSSTAYNSYYLANGTSTALTGSTSMPSLNSMKTLEFAMFLNNCQTDIWKWANGVSTINTGLPVLHWQGLGDDIPVCFDNLTDGITEANAFRIRYAADLIRLSQLNNSGTSFLNRFLIVENNISFISGGIDVSSYFNPIGTSTYPFQGKFNGNGKIISSLTINSARYSGLFGYSSGATINNLGLEGITNRNTDVTAQNYVGGLAGVMKDNSQVRECYITNSTIGASNNTRVGGLIGELEGSTMRNCYARANVIDQTPNSSGDPIYGGLIGVIYNSSKIYNCYAAPTGVVNNGARGSLVGYITGTGTPEQINSYFLTLTGMSATYGTGKTSVQMKSGCFPTNLNNAQNPVVWFKAKSGINDNYPVLSWQKLSDGTPAGFEGNCLSNSTPFLVRYVKDLIFISNMVANDTTYAGTSFVLQNDISFNNCTIDSSSLFSPIGYYNYTPTVISKPFSGTFDGNRKAIANYKFYDLDRRHIGIFGDIKNATIKNLGISNVNITALNNVGGLVGSAEGTNVIDACFVYGYIKGNNNVGGLVGSELASGTTITKSFTNVTIDALTNVGGIVGQHSGSITNSYSNAEIYSSVSGNDYVGGLVGNANAGSSLNTVYSAAKIVRNGTTNTNFGKIRGSNLATGVLNCYSRDSVFVNYTNISPSGYSGASFPNVTLRDPNSVTTLNTNSGATLWKVDFTDNINDGYPIFTYQDAGLKLTANGAWQNPTTASQIVIIPSGVQVKTSTANCPKSAYVKIEKGGELNNQTNLSLFGEYNRELSVGKWNLIGLATNNKNLASLINFTSIPLTNYAVTPYKTIVKRFDPATNNWATVTTQDINTQFDYGEGILVMPNYSLDANYQQSKSRIVSKGILFNESALSRAFTNTATLKFVSLANNYPASINVSASSTNPPIAGNTAGLIQGNLVYVYDTDNAKWINNLSTDVQVTTIKPSEGFFIVSSSISGSFVFNKSQIKNTSGVAKNSYVSDIMYVKATANDETREAFLQMNEDAENGFDFNDGLMMFGSNGNAVEPFFRINAGKEAFDSEIGDLNILKDVFSTLPYMTELDLRSEKVNDLSLNFSNIPSDIHVYLLDSLLRSAQYLNENADYSLKVSAGDNKNRLFVLFSYNKEDINQFFKPEMAEEIRIWNYNNTLHIEGKDLSRYEIYDILGNRLVEEETSEDDYQKSLSLKNGIYIVRAYSKTSSKAEKISINN